MFTSILVFCTNLCAKTTQEEPEPVAEETWEQYLIRKNIEVSEWFDSKAVGLDLFLAGKRYTKKPNETSATLELDGYYSSAEAFKSSADFNVDLRLPNVEEYWQLTFTSYDENEDRRIRDRYLRQTPREKNYGATIGFFKKLGNVRTSFRPRIEFSQAPAISHSLSFESIAEKKSNYYLNPRLEFYASPAKGAGVYQAINFSFFLTKVYSLSFINEGDYQGRIHFYVVNHGVSLGQRLNGRMILGYNFFLSFVNEPNYRLDAVNLSVVWDHLIYKKVLQYQLIPNLDFRQNRSFKINPGVITNIKINF
ncbi:MAG: hypothetical protein ACXVCR_03230 [Bdellovibrio sp.]